MISFHSLHVASKQYYLHSIHFHSFSFLYFKISNQGYLIPFHFILFYSFPLLKYIPFHSLIIIPFHSLPLWTLKRSLRFQNLQFCKKENFFRKKFRLVLWLEKYRFTSKEDTDQFCVQKNSDLYLRKIRISFVFEKNLDLYLRKI